jgi:phosphate starvation-inducible protein PhoH
LDTVVTRVGHSSKIIFCGDYRQTDLRKKDDKSGILKFFDIASLMSEFTRIEFFIDDIVRSSLVKSYIIARTKFEDGDY